MTNLHEHIELKHFDNLKRYEDEKLSEENMSLMIKTSINQYVTPLYIDQGIKAKYEQLYPESGKEAVYHASIFNEKNNLIPSSDNNNSFSMNSFSLESSKSIISDEDFQKIKPENLIKKKFFGKVEIPDILKSPDNSIERTEGIFWNYNRSFQFNKKNKSDLKLTFDENEPVSHVLFTPLCFELPFDSMIETFHCRATIYDMATETRISEYFQFSFDKENDFENFIFECDPSPEIIIVIHIDKIFNFEKDTSDLYFSNSVNKNDIDTSLLRKSSLNFSETLHEFAWCYAQIFNDYGQIRIEERDTTNSNIQMKTSKIFLKKVPMTEEEFFGQIKETIRGIKSFKMSPTTSLVFTVKILNDEKFPENRYDSFLRKVRKPAQVLPGVEGKTYEVQSLIQTMDYLPNVDFQNLLYISPSFICLNKKNIVCDVYFKQKDSEVSQYGEQRIFNISALVEKGMTPIIKNARISKFNCEWKILLPFDLGYKSNILFVFKKIHLEKSKKSENIGYAYLPLIDQEKRNFVREGEHEVGIILQKLTAGYIGKKFKENKKFFGFLSSGKENFFNFKLKLMSTIYDNDVELNRLFSYCVESNQAGRVQERIEQILQIKTKTIVKYILPIMKHLILFIGKGNFDLKKIGFLSIVKILDKLRKDKTLEEEKYNYKNLMKIWVNSYFNNFEDCPIYINIIQLCNHYFKVHNNYNNSGIDDEYYLNFINSIWFWLLCALKSLKLEMHLKKSVREKSKIIENLTELSERIASWCNCYNTNFGIGLEHLRKVVKHYTIFSVNLYLIFSPEDVYLIVEKFLVFLRENNDLTVNELKSNFMKYFFSNTLFREILMRSPEINASNYSKLPKIFSVTNELIENCIDQKNKNLREEYILVLQLILCKFDFDSALKNKKDLMKIANIFFPLISNSCKERLNLEKISVEQRDFLISWQWILFNMDVKIIKHWWKTLEDKQIFNFLHIISNCLNQFKYIGKNRKLLENQTYLSKEMALELNVKFKSETMVDAKKNIENLVKTDYKSTINLQRDNNKTVSGSIKTFSNPGNKKNLTLRKMRINMHKSMKKKTLKKGIDTNILKLIEYEGNLTEILTRKNLTMLVELMEMFRENLPVLEKILDILFDCLSYNNTEFLYDGLCSVIQLYFEIDPNVFFRYKIERVEKMLKHFFTCILQYSTIPNENTISKACYFIYYISKTIYQREKNLELMRNILLFSLHAKGWILNLTTNQMKLCSYTIKSSLNYCAMNEENGDMKNFETSFIKLIAEIDTLIIIFGKIIRMNMQMEQCDKAIYQEILEGIAMTYKTDPVIRFDWLKKLHNHHEKEKNYPEAAECALEMIRTLRNKSKNNIDDTTKENDKQHIEYYSKKAGTLFEKASFHEKMIESDLKILLPILRKQKNYARLSLTHASMATAYKTLNTLKEDDYRNFGNYYMATFYGKPFAKQNGRSYIYRTQKEEQLDTFCSDLMSKTEFEINKEVTLLTDKIDSKELDPEKAFIEINYVQPVNEDSNLISNYEINTYKKKFSYQKRYCDSKENKADLSKQKKIIYHLEVLREFPCLVTRQKVIKSDSEIHSGVKVATDDINAQILKIKKCLGNTTNLSLFESILSGSIMPQVNGGIKNYFDCFYNSEKKIDKSELKKFGENLKEFMRTCKEGINAYYNVIMKDVETKNSKTAFYQALNEYYLKTEKMVNKYSE